MAGKRQGVLASMRVRKKMALLHSLFTAALATILLVTLWPALVGLIREAELNKARTVLQFLAAHGLNEQGHQDPGKAGSMGEQADSSALGSVQGSFLADFNAEDLSIWIGDDAIVQLNSVEQLAAQTDTQAGRVSEVDRVRTAAGQIVELPSIGQGARAALWLEPNPGDPLSVSGQLVVVEARLPEARAAMMRLFALVVVALLGVYVLVAAALELLVLPGAFYDPITRMLRADRAVQNADSAAELIPEAQIPGDEFGEIMRSRNASVLALRASERRLASALEEFEVVADELKKKNHLLETARRNLEGADRLASLGMMSAGIAHELNTPLAVLKGLTERLANRPGHKATPEESALMSRVVGRLERLGESLLDFARASEPRAEEVMLAGVVAEAITLVRLDRQAQRVELVNAVPAETMVVGDPDRLLQVFVNLVRNAVDAVAAGQRLAQNGPVSQNSPASSGIGLSAGTVRVQAHTTDTLPQSIASGGPLAASTGSWVITTVEDTGPGIDPSVVPRLFEPFFSTRLDARGTGLGLAVAEGIVREHGGVLVGRNREDRSGAVFEITLPATAAGRTQAPGDRLSQSPVSDQATSSEEHAL
jgi:signal transduction histidine kinase